MQVQDMSAHSHINCNNFTPVQNMIYENKYMKMIHEEHSVLGKPAK